MFWMRNKENKFPIRILIWRPKYKVYYCINIGLDKQNFWAQIVNIFLPISFNISFGCSKEPSHIFWMRNIEKKIPIRTLIWRPEYKLYYCINIGLDKQNF